MPLPDQKAAENHPSGQGNYGYISPNGGKILLEGELRRGPAGGSAMLFSNHPALKD